LVDGVVWVGIVVSTVYHALTLFSESMRYTELYRLPIMDFANNFNSAAQSTTNIVSKITQYIVDPAILLVFSTALLLFFWGMVEFMNNLRQGGKDIAVGKNHMLWGIIGMLIMLSIRPVITLIADTFGLGDMVGQSRGGQVEQTKSDPFGNGQYGR
jgi:hypothetical protein